MAKSSKDIADALGAMSSGDVEEDAGEIVMGDIDPQVSAPAAPRAEGVKPPSSRAPACQPAAAATPKPVPQPSGSAPSAPRTSSRPAAPVVPPSPTPGTRRPTPVPNPNPIPQVAAPSTAPAAPRPSTSRPSRPAAPQPAAKSTPPAKPKPAAPLPGSATAAPASTKPARPVAVDYAKPETRKKKVKVPYYATLDFRQTVIPPLLVCGVGFIVMCVLYFCQPSDAALRSAGVVPPLLLALFGAALLGLAGLNMTWVKAQLAEAARVKAESKAKSSAAGSRSR